MSGSRYVVIMAGGSGTRLWPLSRQNRPKQLMAIKDGRTLFQQAVDRLDGVVAKDHIFVVTVAEQAPALQANDPGIPIENYLIEPMPRGTASVVGLACAALMAFDPAASMAVVTADHLIENTPVFHQLLEGGFQIAQQGFLVTLGIPPAAPVTGYGYIQRGALLGQTSGQPYYRMARFKEKPTLETAVQFIQAGDHYWNSGMFIWTVKDIWAEFQRLMPELFARLAEISAAWMKPDRLQTVQRLWPAISPQSIDYGIMEQAQHSVVLPAHNLQWSDVGSWDSIWSALPTDDDGNVIIGANHLGVDTTSSLIMSEQSQRLIVTIGVSDLVVIDTGDALLICPKHESQKVREVVKALKESDNLQYL